MPSDLEGFEPLTLQVDPRREAEYFAAILIGFGILAGAANAGISFWAEVE
jgi:hypothetical protein